MASPATVNQDTKALPASEPSIMCSSLDDLWLSDFIKCSVDKNYAVLVRSGKPSAEELEDQWIILASEYQGMVKSKEAKSNAELYSKIERLNAKIINVECLLAALSVNYDEQLIDCLKLWGYTFAFTTETIKQDIPKVLAKLGRDRTQLAIARQTYDEQQAEKARNGDVGAAKKEDYMKILMQISTHYKVNPPYRADSIRVSEFAILCNEINEYSRMINNKANASY